MSKSIKVIVDDEGNVEIKAIGFKGTGCVAATAALEKAMGKVGKRKHTPEYYQSTDANTQLKAGA